MRLRESNWSCVLWLCIWSESRYNLTTTSRSLSSYNCNQFSLHTNLLSVSICLSARGRIATFFCYLCSVLVICYLQTFWRLWHGTCSLWRYFDISWCWVSTPEGLCRNLLLTGNVPLPPPFPSCPHWSLRTNGSLSVNLLLTRISKNLSPMQGCLNFLAYI